MLEQQAEIPECAMVLAAGLGVRMWPLTEKMPKPLIPVWHKTLLDHGLDALASAGVGCAVVNVHYFADQIEAHLRHREKPSTVISDERKKLLDSGGGIKKALCHLGPDPFYLLNADSFWIDGDTPNLAALARTWNSSQMDLLLLVVAADRAVGFDGKGDFFMSLTGLLNRRGEQPTAPFVYAGAAILSPELFDDTPEGPFSLNKLFDEAIDRKRLFGLQLDGLWLTVGTPEAIDLAEQAIAKNAA